MRIIQVLENIIDGDGVSNCALYLKELFDDNGIENYLYAFNYISEREYDNTYCISSLREITFEDTDILYYHFCTGSPLNYEVEHLRCKKVLVFQNVTPPVFFRGVNPQAVATCAMGECDSLFTAGNYLKCITPSNFSKRQLIRGGWNEEDIVVVPIIKKEVPSVIPEKKLVERLNLEGTKILFVGRAVGNKKLEDVIDIFDYYKKNYDDDARLYFVGSTGEKIYYEALNAYIERSGCRNITFTGKVSEEELAAYYSSCDVFLCMSEHEGLCLPVLEAMKYDMPVIAYDAAAIPDTMGGTGVLVDTKNPIKVACEIDKLMKDAVYRADLTKCQKAHVENYCLDGYVENILSLNYELDQLDNYKYRFEDERLKFTKEEPRYALGTVLETGESNAMMPYVLKGIYEYDGYTNWTDGYRALLRFTLEDYNEKPLKMIISLMKTFNGNQHVILKVNGEKVYDGVQCAEGIINVDLSSDIIRKNVVAVELELPNAISPSALDANNGDRRVLALALKSIELREA